MSFEEKYGKITLIFRIEVLQGIDFYFVNIRCLKIIGNIYAIKKELIKTIQFLDRFQPTFGCLP